MNSIEDIVTAAEKFGDAVREAKEAYSAVMNSDGEQVVQALEKLAVEEIRDEVLRCIRSVGALLSSIRILEETSYRGVVLAAAEMIGTTVEYAAAKEGWSSAAQEEIRERVRRLRDTYRDQGEG